MAAQQYSSVDVEQGHRDGPAGSDHNGPARSNQSGHGKGSEPTPDYNLSSSLRGDKSRHAHFGRKQEDRDYPMPPHVYDRYRDRSDGDITDGAMDPGGGAPSEDRYQHDARSNGQYPPDVPVDLEQVTTLYIPKVHQDDGNKTLIRRRRTSSKRRSSSRRKHERENLDELLDAEDNHMLPSLRLQRRIRMKSMKERRAELDEEKRLDREDGKSFKERYNEMKEQDDLTAGNFAELLRDSTLTRVKKLSDWKQPKRWANWNRRRREFFQHFRVWYGSFKEIEGKFGTAVTSYFKFIRWLLFLNIFLMVVMFFSITFPFLVLRPYSFDETLESRDLSIFYSQAYVCSHNYTVYSDEMFSKESTFEKVLDFLQGTGWMERTILFYGQYYNKTYYDADGDIHVYNMGLAYLLAFGACFVVSFIFVVRSSAVSVKATFGMESSVAGFTNRVYAGWDYAITSKKAAAVKQNNLFVEFKACIAEELVKKQRENRSANDMATIILTRIMVTCFVLGILAAALYLVYFLTDTLLKLQKEDLHEIVALIVQYAPYLAITIMNFAIPIVFAKIVVIEKYSTTNALRVTLIRSVLLRLASLMVLIITLARLLIEELDDDDTQANNTTTSVIEAGSNTRCGNQLWEEGSPTARGSIKCWETYVGQQVYKLVLLDLVVEASIVFFMQFPRRLVYNRYGKSSNLIKKIGPQEFDLPQSVIDIVYSQTLCWLGLFYSPLIPFMTFLKCLMFFYLRKWTLLSNCAQSDQHYRTSRSHSLFMFVLLVSFVPILVPVGYTISGLPPSQSCGPFRLYSNVDFRMFDMLTDTIATWPDGLKTILFYLANTGFLLPLIFVLCFLTYMFWLLSQGYKKREKLLSRQLKMESKDKQFLLSRVNEVLMNAEM